MTGACPGSWTGPPVSIWTAAGRLAGIRFACSGAQLARLRQYRQGESDLAHRDGMWFLHATCDIPEPDLADLAGFLGVDLGIVNIATTSDGTRHSGKHLNRQRHRARHLRARLQAPGQRHQIRETAAEETGQERSPLRRRHQPLHRWAFAQLGRYTAYKAAVAGIPVVHVDPAYTSQMCSACGHISRKNRPGPAAFCCTSCGFAEHAGLNAARNIATRGAADWAVSHAADDAARTRHPGAPVTRKPGPPRPRS